MTFNNNNLYSGNNAQSSYRNTFHPLIVNFKTNFIMLVDEETKLQGGFSTLSCSCSVWWYTGILAVVVYYRLYRPTVQNMSYNKTGTLQI